MCQACEQRRWPVGPTVTVTVRVGERGSGSVGVAAGASRFRFELLNLNSGLRGSWCHIMHYVTHCAHCLSASAFAACAHSLSQIKDIHARRSADCSTTLLRGSS